MIDLTTLADLTPGICSVTLRSQGGIDDVVRISSDAGLAGIEWGGTDVHVSDSESAAHAKEATVAAGLSVLSLGSYYRCGAFEDFGRALDLATGLGAPRIRVWAGELGSAEANEDHWDAVVQDTRRIADLAAARGIAIAFEYHGNTLTDSPATTLDLLNRVNHPTSAPTGSPPSDFRTSRRLSPSTKSCRTWRACIVSPGGDPKPSAFHYGTGSCCGRQSPMSCAATARIWTSCWNSLRTTCRKTSSTTPLSCTRSHWVRTSAGYSVQPIR